MEFEIRDIEIGLRRHYNMGMYEMANYCRDNAIEVGINDLGEWYWVWQGKIFKEEYSTCTTSIIHIRECPNMVEVTSWLRNKDIPYVIMPEQNPGKGKPEVLLNDEEWRQRRPFTLHRKVIVCFEWNGLPVDAEFYQVLKYAPGDGNKLRRKKAGEFGRATENVVILNCYTTAYSVEHGGKFRWQNDMADWWESTDIRVEHR